MTSDFLRALGRPLLAYIEYTSSPYWWLAGLLSSPLSSAIATSDGILWCPRLAPIWYFDCSDCYRSWLSWRLLFPVADCFDLPWKPMPGIFESDDSFDWRRCLAARNSSFSPKYSSLLWYCHSVSFSHPLICQDACFFLCWSRQSQRSMPRLLSVSVVWSSRQTSFGSSIHRLEQLSFWRRSCYAFLDS